MPFRLPVGAGRPAARAVPRRHGSGLASSRSSRRERGVDVVSGEPTIGGRYSALSAVRARAGGARRRRRRDAVLERAEAMHDACRVEDGTRGSSSGSRSARAGRMVATRSSSTTPSGFGLWLEQLIAESTGKDGKGLVPGSRRGSPTGDRPPSTSSSSVDDPYDLGAEFFRFELAVAVAGAVLGVNPFDQPDVEEAKERARALPFPDHGSRDSP